MLGLYALTVLILVVGAMAYLNGFDKSSARQPSKTCPLCGARLFFRQMQRNMGKWVCGACGCDHDEFNNKL